MTKEKQYNKVGPIHTKRPISEMERKRLLRARDPVKEADNLKIEINWSKMVNDFNELKRLLIGKNI